MRVFQLRLDERERPSCVKEVEVSSPSTFTRTGRNIWLVREMTVCVVLFVLLWSHETLLSLPHFSTVKSLERRVQVREEVMP